MRSKLGVFGGCSFAQVGKERLGLFKQSYKGKEIIFPARLQFLGYTCHFLVDVYGEYVVFEFDEEWPIVLLEQNKLTKSLDKEFLQASVED